MTTANEIKTWLSTYNRNWNGLCQALVWQVTNKFGSASVVYSSALNAYHASGIISLKENTAPAGAIHYWDIGTYGHVAIELGSGRVLMGSSHVSESWGVNVGVTSVYAYSKATGAKYLGWARTNGRNSVDITQPATVQASAGVFAVNLPDNAGQKRVQAALAGMGRYSGPVDGVIGVAGFKGLQTTAAKVGYDGPIDGVLGERSCYFLQVYAKAFGDYTGPTDSVMGEHSWLGVSLGLERK